MSLVEISEITKKAVVLTIVTVIVLITGWMLKEPVKDLYASLFPPEDLPTVEYGILDQLTFYEIEMQNPEVEYVLNTSTGRLPTNLPDKMTVYKYTPPAFSYSAGKNAQDDAATLGFTEEMRTSSLSDKYFTWEDLLFGGKLLIDTKRTYVTLTTPMAGLGSLYPNNVLTSGRAVDKATYLLEGLKQEIDPMYLDPIAARTTVTFGKFGTAGLIEANSQLEAQVAKVDFNRSIGSYPIVTAKPYDPHIQVVVRGESDDDYLQLDYPVLKVVNTTINTTSTATYPLTPISTAWENVISGNAAIAGVNPNTRDPFSAQTKSFNPIQILINDIYVAYLDSEIQQTYLQPVYVFEGNYIATTDRGDITIYYPAVAATYINQPLPPEETQQ